MYLLLQRGFARAVAVLLLLGCALAPARAVAQEDDEPAPGPARKLPPRGLTAGERSLPDFHPKGIHAGGFVLHPGASAGIKYRDNVFFSSTDEKSDLIFEETVSLDLRTTWSRHDLRAFLAVGQEQYLENSSQNATSVRADLDGQIELGVNGSLAFTTTYESRPEDVIDPETRGEAGRRQFKIASAGAEYRHQWSTIEGRLSARVASLNFEPTPSDDPDFVRNRDRDVISIAPRLTYRVSPRLGTFVQVSQTHVDFTDPDSRDSETTTGLVGFSFDLNGVLFGELGAGYFVQRFEEGENNTGGALSGEMTWNFSSITSLIARLSRREAATGRVGATDRTQTLGSAELQHELRRNILVATSASYYIDEYKGAFDDRINTAALSLRGRYALSRNVSLVPELRHVRRDQDTEDLRSQTTIALRTVFRF
jgi:hypothetical protein